MLAWMGGKRSKLKPTRGNISRRPDTPLKRVGKRAATQDLQRLSQRHNTNGDAFQQLCAAAHVENDSHSPFVPAFQTNPTVHMPIPANEALSQDAVSAQGNSRPQVHMKQPDNLSQAATAFVNGHLQPKSCFTKSPSAEPGHYVQSDAFENGPGAASTVLPSQVHKQQRSRSDISLDLLGIALHV